jgi:hypothetical protein
MEYNEQDNDVIRLLRQLREAEGGYPVEMMTSRRRGYVKQIAALGIGAGVGVALKASAKGAGGSSIPPIAGTIVETILIVAIVIEAGVVAITNREKVLELFRSTSSQPAVAQISTSTPDSAIPVVEPMLIDTLEPTQIVVETFTAVSTPSPDMLLFTDMTDMNDMNVDDVDAEADLQSNSTPAPNDDNGNHYGQTPIPARTKSSGGGSDQNEDDRDNRNNGNSRR